MRLLVVLSAVLAALALAVALGARRLAESEPFRAGVERALGVRLGVPVRVREVAIGWLPPRARLKGPIVLLPGGTELRLEWAVLEMRPGPLLRARTVLERLEAGGDAVLAVGSVVVPGRVSIALDPVPGSDLFALDASGSLAGGGFVATGTVGAGTAAVRAEVTGVELGRLHALWAGRETASEIDGPASPRFAGSFDGTLAFGEDGSGLVTLLARSRRAFIENEGLTVSGPIAVRASLDLAGDAPGGELEIDANDARVAYGVGVQKASGQGAVLRARILLEQGRLALDELGVRVRRLEANLGKVEAGPRAGPGE